jgi:hypothetical protein
MFVTARDRANDRRVFLFALPCPALLLAPFCGRSPLSVRGTSLGALRAPAFAAYGSREARAPPRPPRTPNTIGRARYAPHTGLNAAPAHQQKRLGSEG